MVDHRNFSLCTSPPMELPVGVCGEDGGSGGVRGFRKQKEELLPSHKKMCRLWRQLDDATMDAAVDRMRTSPHGKLPEA